MKASLRSGVFGLVALGLLVACSDRPDSAFYADRTDALLAKRYLRTDHTPPDAPFTAEDLARAFERIVFRYEFHFRDGVLVNEPLPKPLKRWQGRIRYRLTGDAAGPEDRRTVTDLFATIQPLTGLRFVESDDDADMIISIASPSGRAAVSAELAALGRPDYQRRYEIWRRTPAWTCGATLSSDPDMPDRLVFAHVFLAAEISGRMRTACLHEEITQSLGLTNDSDSARPSIFNDDSEFAHMTRHDEILLRALYDPRLTPGVGAREAMPLVRQILRDLAGAPRRDPGDTVHAQD